MKTVNDKNRFLSLAQAAKILKISRIAAYKRVRSGALKALRVGRGYIVEAGDLSGKERGGAQARIDFGDLRFGARLAGALRQSVWDYKISAGELFKILTGKKTTFSLNQAKLSARLLASVPWYELIDILGARRLSRMINEDTLAYVWNPGLKEKLLLAREALDER